MKIRLTAQQISSAAQRGIGQIIATPGIWVLRWIRTMIGIVIIPAIATFIVWKQSTAFVRGEFTNFPANETGVSKLSEKRCN